MSMLVGLLKICIKQKLIFDNEASTRFVKDVEKHPWLLKFVRNQHKTKQMCIETYSFLVKDQKDV